MRESLAPTAVEPAVVVDRGADVVLPALIVDAGPDAVARFLEFFAGRIANGRTRSAYGKHIVTVLGMRRQDYEPWGGCAPREGGGGDTTPRPTTRAGRRSSTPTSGGVEEPTAGHFSRKLWIGRGRA